MMQVEQICCQKGVELRGRPTGKGSRSTAGGGDVYGRPASERGGDQLQGRGELCVDPPAAGSKNCFVPASSKLPQSDWTVVKRLVVGREMHLWWTGGRKEMHLEKGKNEENREI